MIHLMEMPRFGLEFIPNTCDDVEVSVYDQNELFDQEYQCNDEDASGYTYVGGWYAEQSQTYTITSNEVVYVSDVEEVGEAVGGFMAILGSWGVLCCGANLRY